MAVSNASSASEMAVLASVSIVRRRFRKTLRKMSGPRRSIRVKTYRPIQDRNVNTRSDAMKRRGARQIGIVKQQYLLGRRHLSAKNDRLKSDCCKALPACRAPARQKCYDRNGGTTSVINQYGMPVRVPI